MVNSAAANSYRRIKMYLRTKPDVDYAQKDDEFANKLFLCDILI